MSPIKKNDFDRLWLCRLFLIFPSKINIIQKSNSSEIFQGLFWIWGSCNDRTNWLSKFWRRSWRRSCMRTPTVPCSKHHPFGTFCQKTRPKSITDTPRTKRRSCLQNPNKSPRFTLLKTTSMTTKACLN